MDGWSSPRSPPRCARPLPDVLVATDFDGTLAPLVPDPQQSQPVDGAVDVLADAGPRRRAGRGDHRPRRRDRRAARRARPRPRRDRRRSLRHRDLARRRARDARHPGPDPRRCSSACPVCSTAPTRRCGSRTSGSRSSSTPAAPTTRTPRSRRCTSRSPTLADELGLEMHPGRDVLELRLPGYDKAGAHRPARRRPRGVRLPRRRPRRRPCVRAPARRRAQRTRRLQRGGAVVRGRRRRPTPPTSASPSRPTPSRSCGRCSADCSCGQRVQLRAEPLGRRQPHRGRAHPRRPARRARPRGISSAACSASAPADTSNGLTAIASSPSTSAAPISREITTAGSRSDSTSASSTTRFMPSRTEFTNTTSLRRSAASAAG